MTWIALLGTVALMGPTAVSELAFAPLVVFFLVRTFNTFGTWVHWFGQPMFLLVMLWTLWQAVSLAWSGDVALGLGELGQNRWALIGVLVWPIIHKRRAVLAALAVGFTLAHVAQLVQLIGITLGEGGTDPVFGRDPRRVSGWWDPVVGGSLLVGAAGLHLPIAVWGRGRTRWIARAGLLAAVLGVIATGTRGAWVAVAALIVGAVLVGVLVGVWGRRGAERGSRSRVLTSSRVVLGVCVVIAGLGVWLLVGDAVSSRVEQARTEITQAYAGDTDSDIGRRLNMYEWGGRAVLTRPVRGVGAGGFRAWVQDNDGPFVFDHAHSSAVHIGATTGVVGLMVWGAIVFVVLRNGMMHTKSFGRYGLGDPSGTAGPMFAIVGLVLVSGFDVVHLNAQTAALFWVLAGVCVTWEPAAPRPAEN